MMKSIGNIVKDIGLPHMKGNMRLNPEFLFQEQAHIYGLLLVTDYKRMYQIDIYNSKNGNITIVTNKLEKFLLDIYQLSNQDLLQELLHEFKEGQFDANLTREEPLGKIRRHDIELYLDVERPYSPILRGPPDPESLETRKEMKKHLKEPLDLDFIRNIGHNEIVEVTTPVLITWHDVLSRLCGDFR
ncbi:hypothetical protein O181_026159 [Austropuccinia psidii MF-1]|uniref:Uncharacterized protein n=1 Tax=Austropuccinia psidii MF-1 TaxID=1389203 RepID=A0A9Q3H1C7_9BASI|nr:hypothetical protein [Austropuccinia psidii MF-1]